MIDKTYHHVESPEVTTMPYDVPEISESERENNVTATMAEISTETFKVMKRRGRAGRWIAQCCITSICNCQKVIHAVPRKSNNRISSQIILFELCN
jgi:hypothetical protein